MGMGAKGKNKVKFNLKNVHIAPIKKEDGEYDEIFALPGAVNLSLEAQGDIEKFYADGIVYFQSAANNGYEGDLEVALVTDEFRQKILGETKNEENVLIENVDAQFHDFAMGFQIDGDSHNTLFWYYNCTVSRPNTEASTIEESKTPQTETLSISCAPDKDGNIRAKTTDETAEEKVTAWFQSVYKKAEA